MEDTKIVNGYFQGSDGKWYLSGEAKSEAKALYYNRRLAYGPQDTRHAIGTYNEFGEIVPFKNWHNSAQ